MTDSYIPYPTERPPLSDEARQAIIDARRAMKDVRRYAAEHRAKIDAEWSALTEPPRTIAGHLAGLSAERRAELDREFE